MLYIIIIIINVVHGIVQKLIQHIKYINQAHLKKKNLNRNLSIFLVTSSIIEKILTESTTCLHLIFITSLEEIKIILKYLR